MSLLDGWLADLAYTDFPDELFKSGGTAGMRPYAAELEEMLAPDRGIGASAIFCVGDQPTVCIIDGTSLAYPRDYRIEQIRQRVWNQNLLSVVLVLDPDALTAYAVNERGAEPQILARTNVDRHGCWSAYEIQTGFIKDRLSDWFTPEARVDQRLLANLRQVVKEIADSGLTETQAEALMAQVIFLCYLEQRGIVGDAYRETHELETLETYVARGDGRGVDRLLKQLGADFNGDFLSSSDGGAPLWSTLEQPSFDCISRFLEAVDFESGQGSFWRYDFSHIPVELISGIYETLLKDRQDKLGAYYTPRHLANLAAEQAFEGFADPSRCTIYDGACGSGILLTTAFRKMLRCAEIMGGRRLRFSNRVALMQRNLFGSDIDETACWITAFSLYLSLLEGLDPADISLLQSDQNLKLPRLVGPGLNIQKGSARGDFFSTGNPHARKNRFDIFLCNPPWRESGDRENPTWEDWCKAQTPPYPIGKRQIAAGFAFRATETVKQSGVVTLILPLNLLIGATSQSSAFRQRWLQDVRIDRIINFGDVRRLLFPAAKHPCAVVRVRPRSRADTVISLSDEMIEYWTPKTDMSLALGRLALHAVDRKLLSAREVYESPYALISSYWGERRDLDLLKRLRRLGTLGETMTHMKDAWRSGKGFHAPNQSNRPRSLGVLQSLAFLDTARFPDAYPVIADDVQLERVRDRFSIVASPGGANGKLYRGSRVIFPDGLTNEYAVRAIYTEVPFAFTSSIGAIGSSTKDANLLKFLAAYLRSPLASYLLVMTGYSVIGERPRIALEDVKEFPFVLPPLHPEPGMAAAIVERAANALDELATESELLRGHAYAKVKKKLDNLVYDYFQLDRTERILVNDTVRFIATSIQPPDYERLSTPLLERPRKEEIEDYLGTLSRELAGWRKRSKGKGFLAVRAVLDGVNGFFGAVRIRVERGEGDRSKLVTSPRDFEQLIKDVQDSVVSQSSAVDRDDFFKVPNIMVVSGEEFVLVKPLRRRFWMGRSALSDADHLVRTVHSMAWVNTRS